MKRGFRITVLLLLFAVPAPVSRGADFSLPFFTPKRNVILIVPDGCSVPMWAAIRAMTVGTDGELAIDRMPVNGRSRTYSADSIITDSAAVATALATGVKARNGVLAMDAMTIRGDSLSGSPVETIIEKAEKRGYATGLVSTASVLHATPAGFYSHRAHRDWYELIANDLVGKGIDVIMGGGREYMIPAGTVGPEGEKSKRRDSRSIIDELRSEGYVYVRDKVGFDSYTPSKDDRLLGIFNPGHMQYEFDRMKDTDGEPALWEMTEKAIDLLSRKKKGFFLLVEAARIDHAAHVHDTDRFLWDGIACDKSVAVAMDFARKNKNTLVIVVPDHGTGGPHLAGIYEVSDGDSTLVDYDKAGFVKYTLNSDGFPVLDNGRKVALIWADTLGHTGEDVALSAAGPGSESLGGLTQNTDVNRVMLDHLRLGTARKTEDEHVIDY